MGIQAEILYSKFRYFLHYFILVKEYYEIYGQKISKEVKKEEVMGFKTIKEAKDYYNILNNKEKEEAYIWDIAKKCVVSI